MKFLIKFLDKNINGKGDFKMKKLFIGQPMRGKTKGE